MAKGKISRLTRIGTALVGLSVGQSIDWVARNGLIHRLKAAVIQELDSHFPALAITIESDEEQGLF
ncbi:hypothetical protein ASC97_21295 [Rhizobium sp. Root1203]|nr:hypothetical protein ASC97_21295 [Rhizobium sp. Root1203]